MSDFPDFDRERRVQELEDELRLSRQRRGEIADRLEFLSSRSRQVGGLPKTFFLLALAVVTFFSAGALWALPLENLVPQNAVQEPSLLHRLSLPLAQPDSLRERQVLQFLGFLLVLVSPLTLNVSSIRAAHRIWVATGTAICGVGLLALVFRAQSIPLDRFSFAEGSLVSLPLCALTYCLVRRRAVYWPGEGSFKPLGPVSWSALLLIIPSLIALWIGLATGVLFAVLGLVASTTSIYLLHIATVNLETLESIEKAEAEAQEAAQELSRVDARLKWLRTMPQGGSHV